MKNGSLINYQYYYGIMNIYLRHRDYFRAMLATEQAIRERGVNTLNIELYYTDACLRFYQQDWQQAKKATCSLLVSIVLAEKPTPLQARLSRYNRLMVAGILLFASIQIMQHHQLKSILPKDFYTTKKQEKQLLQQYFAYRCTSFFPDNHIFSKVADEQLYLAFAELPFKAKEILAGITPLIAFLQADDYYSPDAKQIITNYVTEITHLTRDEMLKLADNDILVMFTEQDTQAAKKHLQNYFSQIQITDEKWDRASHDFIFTTDRGRFRVRGFDGQIMEENHDKKELAWH